ncbi:alpha/beta fold hydrolase [Bacillaceae bacterium SIJ1]|uniref:alpha/beta hydrolase n=1 Tax=Litoribacterium kuwaitense TaxID=1398745 RepID=UPI0013EB9641|nr:alpha/beta fold hydrolase [Litoribacterium kuwaitense]NGP46049.1 alpha/beta fold hydrolase [Litoribacterium kuwaitense]
MQNNDQVMKNAEAFYYPGNEVGVLVIHGFTGTTQSMHSVGKQIADAGYTVYGPRLTGHGTNPEDMEQATYRDWIDDVEAGLEKVKETCSKVFVVGLSMGGALTLYLAENHPEIAGIVPINAAVDMGAFKQSYNALRESGERFVAGIGSDIKKDGVKELAYEQTPVKAMGELVELMKIVKGDLTKIEVPALVLSSTVDHVVPPENSQTIYKSIASEDKHIVMLENSYHVATLDHDEPLIVSQCLTFIKTH